MASFMCCILAVGLDGGVAASRRLLRAASQRALVQYRNLGLLRAASQRSSRCIFGVATSRCPSLEL